LACTFGEAIVVVSLESRDTRVVYEPTAPDDPRVISARVADDGRVIYFKSIDEAGRASLWSLPIEGGRPTLLVHFADEERPSIRTAFEVGAGRFFFTIDERESEIWVADFVQ
ncbi:MAG: hypothetical protein OEP95_16485, partial [Myxococcales bacterium]|nr:hypothetical protein [Myxococcales bacterium]